MEAIKFISFTFLILSFQPSAAGAELSPEELRLKTVEKLYQENYFKNGTCRDVANTLLERHHLPLIGKTDKSLKRHFDRSQENSSLPGLRDEAVDASKNQKIVISTKGDKASWTATVQRSSLDLKQNQTQLLGSTQFHFSVSGSDEQPICSFESWKFTPSDKNQPSQILTETHCLDLFISSKFFAELEKKNPAWAQFISVAKEDCAFALHYSQKAMAMVKQPKKK